MHLHIQPNSLCKDRAEYISTVAVSVITDFLEKFRGKRSMGNARTGRNFKEGWVAGAPFLSLHPGFDCNKA